ncbi:hypothetical protein LXL04_030534 [Taraxacum kok-saghyz]
MALRQESLTISRRLKRRPESSKLRSVTSMAANRTSASSKSTSTQNTATPTKSKTKRKAKPKPKPIQDESNQPQTPQNNQLNPSSSSTPKRTKSPGFRVVGKRIYDSKNGKTCHQCRQKTLDFSVTCTNQGENKKPCPLNVCQACLLNRYGENAEEAAESADWKCPRCRGICNCSFCMKKRGCGPTGSLALTTKKIGFKSVSSFLDMSGCQVAKTANGGSRKRQNVSDKEPKDEMETNEMKEEVVGESEDEKDAIPDLNEDPKVEIQLPQGIELTNLAGIDLPSEDIGHALQLLEFCETFGEVFEVKEGEPEIILRELTCMDAHKTHEALIVKFHIRLLSLIEEDSGKKYSGNSWEEDFKECITESQILSKTSLVECFNEYNELNFSKKLRLLNFLCDEALCTAKMRLWIEEQNVVEKKKAKEKLVANREKEKTMKKKVQDEVAKAILSRNGVPLSISEQRDLILKIKTETAQTIANSLDLREVPRESHIVRLEPVLLEKNGSKLWRLKGYCDKIGTLLQDSCYGDAISFDEKWFSYSDQDKALVDQYISTYRNIRE